MSRKGCRSLAKKQNRLYKTGIGLGRLEVSEWGLVIVLKLISG